MGILGGDGGPLRTSLACLGSQVPFEMFKRYAASHVKRHFTWLHTYNLVVKWRLRRAYTWSHIAPKFPPSIAWVLMQCRSIRDNSAPSSGTHEDVVTLCRAYIRRAGTCGVIFQLYVFFFFFFLLILIQLIQCLWTFKHIKTYKNI